MSRLIDADKLQEELEKVKKESATLVDLLHIIEFQIMVDEQPTAFDVDKVVEQLEETREKDIPRINKTTTKRDEKVYKLAMSYAIHIVKAGGIDE